MKIPELYVNVKKALSCQDEIIRLKNILTRLYVVKKIYIFTTDINILY